MPVTWNVENDAKLLLAIIKTHPGNFISDELVAELQKTVSPDVNKKTVQNRIGRLRAAVKDGKLNNGEGASESGPKSKAKAKTNGATKKASTKAKSTHTTENNDNDDDDDNEAIPASPLSHNGIKREKGVDSDDDEDKDVQVKNLKTEG